MAFGLNPVSSESFSVRAVNAVCTGVRSPFGHQCGRVDSPTCADMLPAAARVLWCLSASPLQSFLQNPAVLHSPSLLNKTAQNVEAQKDTKPDYSVGAAGPAHRGLAWAPASPVAPWLQVLSPVAPTRGWFASSQQGFPTCGWLLREQESRSRLVLVTQSCGEHRVTCTLFCCPRQSHTEEQTPSLAEGLKGHSVNQNAGWETL